MPASGYTWIHALTGGVLIGLGSLLAILATGKIPGISGLFSRILRPRKGDTAWRVIFLVGLVAGAGISFALSETAAIYRPTRSLLVVAAAGLLVGFGTRLGGGCTSGHGVCGLGLGSKTSLAATATFIVAGIITVYVLHHGGNALLR